MTIPGPFFVVDMRSEWNKRPYLSFWRPKNANYAYPLVWAGRYELHELEYGYHYQMDGRWIVRCPVACHTIERLAIDPMPGIIDGDTGPVVVNTPTIRKFVRDNAFAAIPTRLVETMA